MCPQPAPERSRACIAKPQTSATPRWHAEARRSPAGTSPLNDELPPVRRLTDGSPCHALLRLRGVGRAGLLLVVPEGVAEQVAELARGLVIGQRGVRLVVLVGVVVAVARAEELVQGLMVLVDHVVAGAAR